jgi:hypothetical protein
MKNLFSRMFSKHGSQKAVEVVKVTLGEELKFGQATLADGVTVVTFPEDAPMVGEPINVVVEGQEMPAPDGEHALADGSIVVVAQGIVTEIRPAAPAEEQAPAAPVEAPMAEEAEVSAPVKRLIESVVKESIFAVEEKHAKDIEALRNEFKAQVAEKDEVIATMAETIAKFAAEPAAKPAEQKPTLKPKFKTAFEMALDKAKNRQK